MVSDDLTSTAPRVASLAVNEKSAHTSISTADPDTSGTIEAAPEYILEAKAQRSAADLAVEKVNSEAPPATTPEANDSFVVWWQEPANEDPENPMNWSGRHKWSIISMLSFITFLTYVLYSKFEKVNSRPLADSNFF